MAKGKKKRRPDGDAGKPLAEQDHAGTQAQGSDQEGSIKKAQGKSPSTNKTKDMAPRLQKRPIGLKQRYFIAANALYRRLYLVGIQLHRRVRFCRRQLARATQDTFEEMRARRRFHKRSLRLYLLRTWSEFCAPFREFRKKRDEFFKRRENVKRYGTRTMLAKLYLQMSGYLLMRLLRALRYLFNYIAPAAAGVLMFWMVRYLNGLPMALEVTYNGEMLGYIADESVFHQAENDMKGRIVNEAYIRPEDSIPQFELALVRSGEPDVVSRIADQLLDWFGLQMIEESALVSADDLTNELIQASGNEIQEADGLYIEDRFVSAVTEGDALLDYMNGMLERYRTSDMDETAKIQFVKKVQLRHGLYPVSSVKPLSEVKARISGEERGEKTYTVVAGDDPLTIAAKNGITLAELTRLNPDVTESLFVGDELLISQSVPYLGVQVTLIERREEEIDYQIEQRTNANEDIGWTRTVQAGKKGLREVTEAVRMVDGVEVERTTVESRVLRQPVTQILEVGGNRPLAFIPQSSSGSTPTGTWGWPTVGGGINMPWMGYYNHTGSDISWSGCYGSPVLASQDGTVVVAKYSAYGYGYHIIIEHGGGYQTLYAHMSRLDVVPGQQVSKGDQLGLIGQTGNATGPHVHFEIRVNGRPTNPEPYLYG